MRPFGFLDALVWISLALLWLCAPVLWVFVQLDRDRFDGPRFTPTQHALMFPGLLLLAVCCTLLAWTIVRKRGH